MNMKKLICALTVVILLSSVASASIIVQAQANTMGEGVGLGLSMPVVPTFLDLGIEGNAAVSPWSYHDKGSYTDDNTKQKVDYEGTLSWKGSRYGAFAKFNFILITPIIHAGTQQGLATIDGDLRVPGQGTSIGESANIYGSYITLGIPFYLGPLFAEIQAGTQSLYIPHYVNIPSVTDVQLSFGLSFL
jgi:hypothetical protein